MPFVHKFVWPATDGTESVAVTGDFDNWSISQGVLQKKDSGDFVGEVRLDSPKKIVFKFVINDSQWITSPKYNIEHDEHGNANNYLDPEDLEEVGAESKELEGSIPVADLGQSHASEDFSNESDALVDVQTSQSSYAALSLPSDGFEDLGDDDQEFSEEPEELTQVVGTFEEDETDTGGPSGGQPRHRNAPIDIETPRGSGTFHSGYPSSYKNSFTGSGDTTPTNSLPSAGFFGAKQQPAALHREDSEVSTLGYHSRSSSYIGKSQQGNKAQDPLVVNSPEIATNAQAQVNPQNAPQREKKRGDRLVSRFKGLFF